MHDREPSGSGGAGQLSRPRRSRRTALWLALVLVGLIGLTTAAVALTRSGASDPAADPSAINPGLATRLATSAPSAPAATRSSTSRAPATHATSTPASSATEGRSSTGVPGANTDVARAPGQPVRIAIPAAAISAPVDPVGVESDGEVQIPEDVTRVGWYRYSVAPGSSAGSTVLVGHVDSAVQGEGAFFGLHTLAAGNVVRLQLAGGRTLTYRVVSRQQFPKGQVPLQALFALTGAPRLTLITCGGSFNETIRSYRDNIVITAVPA